MSSGISWTYEIYSTSGPPMSLHIGRSWVSGNEPDRLAVRLVGISACATAYARVPGCGGHRQLWIEYVRQGYCRLLQSAEVRPDGTAREWLQNMPFVNQFTDEVLSVGGLSGDELFGSIIGRANGLLKTWASDKWGICPQVTWDIRHAVSHEQLPDDERARVLSALAAFEAFDPVRGVLEHDARVMAAMEAS